MSPNSLLKLWDLNDGAPTTQTSDSTALSAPQVPDAQLKFTRPCRSESSLDYYLLLTPLTGCGGCWYTAYEASEPISSIAWHPTKEYRILTVTHSAFVEVSDSKMQYFLLRTHPVPPFLNWYGQVVSLHESIPVSWAPYGDLAFAYGRHVVLASVPISPSPRNSPIIL